MADVFISYCSADRELAQGVEQELASAALTSVWWDRDLRSGDSYRNTLKQELTAAKAAVIIWTANSAASHWVAAEASLAAHLGTHVPLRDPELRSKELPLPFAEFEATNLYDTDAWIETIRQRLGGAKARASDHPSYRDERWAGVWLLDPKLVPYSPDDVGPSPASLLVARHAIVPFIEIAGEKAALIAWAEGTPTDPTAQRTVSGRLIHAPGGFGKTRLVIEAAQHLADKGWHAGFVERGTINGPNAVMTERLRKLIVEPIADRPLLIAVDYAESRKEDVDWLVARLLERRAKGHTRARLVLLGRADGDWWQTLAKAPDPARILCDTSGKPDATALGLAGAAFSADQRQAFFEASHTAFRDVLAAAARQLPTSPPSAAQVARVRDDKDRDRPLALQMEALLHLYGEAPEDERIGIPELLDRILIAETQHWWCRLNIKDDKAGQAEQRHVSRGVVQLTLVSRVDTVEDAAALVKRDDHDGARSDGAAEDVCNQLHGIMGSGSGFGGLEPDLIGEHHVAVRADGAARFKTMTVATGEFIRRFLIHVLPKRFHRIRHYGLLANGNRAENVAKARELLGVPTPGSEPEPEIAKDDGPRVHTRACPCCGSAMIVIEEFAQGMRAEVASDSGPDPDRHIMSQRPTAFVSPDRKRWSAAGNDHARLRQRHRHRNTRDSDAMRGASNRETAVAAMHGQKDLRSSLSRGPTVRTSAPVQSP